MKRVLVLAAALALATGSAAQAREHHHDVAGAYCDEGEHYVNVSGHCVHRLIHAAHRPAGATAQCRDGSYTFSEHHRGTCSHHDGVWAWL